MKRIKLGKYSNLARRLALGLCCAFTLILSANAGGRFDAARTVVRAAAVSQEAAKKSNNPEKSTALNRSWTTGEKGGLPALSEVGFSKKIAGSVNAPAEVSYAEPLGMTSAPPVPSAAAGGYSGEGRSWFSRFWEGLRNAVGSFFNNSKDVPARTPGTAEEERLRAKLIDALASNVLANGASAAGRSAAERIVRSMTRDMTLEAIRGLVDYKTTVALVPKGKKITDLPQWADLKGTSSLDGRAFDDIDGLAGERDWVMVVSAKERNLLEVLPLDSYPPKMVLVHEYGHAVKFSLPYELRSMVETHFGEQRTFMSGYAASNSDEYFAEATVAWFGLYDGIYGFMGAWRNANWLSRNDPEMYSILKSVYGSPRKV